MGKRKRAVPEDERTFEVTVWDMTNGDIVKKHWNATLAEVNEIEAEFSDEPFRSVQVEER